MITGVTSRQVAAVTVSLASNTEVRKAASGRFMARLAMTIHVLSDTPLKGVHSLALA
jgi:hypothetical protein